MPKKYVKRASSKPTRIFTFRSLAPYLAVSVSQVRRFRRERLLRGFRYFPRGRIHFDCLEVEAFLEKYRSDWDPGAARRKREGGDSL